MKWEPEERNENTQKCLYLFIFIFRDVLNLRLEFSRERETSTLPDHWPKLQMSLGMRWLMWELGVANSSCSSHWYFYNSFLTVVAFFCVMAVEIQYLTFCESSQNGCVLFRYSFHAITCHQHDWGDFQNMFAFVWREKVLMVFFLCNRRIFHGGAPSTIACLLTWFSSLFEHSYGNEKLLLRQYSLMNCYWVRQITSVYY